MQKTIAPARIKLTHMKKIKRISKKILLSYRGLPDKKQYLEFITAFLSIPMLLTIILLNYNNLKSLNKPASTNSTPEQQKIYITQPTNTANQTTEASPSNSNCKPTIGPIKITSPTEGQTVTDNPTSININYQTGTYCAVVWSYRINGSDWSDFDNKSIALYNLPQGNIKLDLRVKSIASDQEEDLSRNFIYNGKNTTSTPTTPNDKTSSASANQ